MRLIQAEQLSFHSGRSPIFGLRFLLLAANVALPASISGRYRSFYDDSATSYRQTRKGLCARSDKPCLLSFAKAKEKQHHPQANAS